MKTLICILIVSLVVICLMLVAKMTHVDQKYPRYMSFRAKADNKVAEAIARVRMYRVHVSEASRHFFKKSMPLFFAHLSSIIAGYMLKKSSRVVDMVKGRHVIDHSGTVSPFLDQVADYKDQK